METVSPPSGGKKDYQNIFDFERKSTSSPTGPSDSVNKNPKKPMVSKHTHTPSHFTYPHIRPLMLPFI